MKTAIMKTAIMALLLAQAGICAAAQDQGHDACSWLMTEAECTQHRETLAGLRDTARQAYLEQHLSLLREREVMCGCTPGRQVLARARYR